MKKANLTAKFTLFSEYWSPKIIGEVNDAYVKLAKLKGEFVWHTHDKEDELFYVVKGNLLIKLPDEDVSLCEGELFIVPKGVAHLPVAEEEAHVLFIEPKSTINTGEIKNNKTNMNLEWI